MTLNKAVVVSGLQGDKLFDKMLNVKNTQNLKELRKQAIKTFEDNFKKQHNDINNFKK
ncbi:MAG: hypothetical protein MJ188_07790 [Treponema sp.]|nr:hypothetical protein [Treponema sp.]